MAVDDTTGVPRRPDVLGVSPPADLLPFPLDLVEPADGRVLIGVVVAGVATDIALRAGGAGAAGALLVTLVAAAMLAGGRIRNPQAVALVAAAPAFGVWLMLRSSPWLLPADVLAAGALLALGASLARQGTVLDLSPSVLVARAVHAMAHGAVAPAFVVNPIRTAWRSSAPGSRRRSVVRGFLLAVPLLAVMGLLLGSADPVFASWFRLPTDPRTAFLHAVAVVLGAWGMGGLLRLASAETVAAPVVRLPGVGPVEALVVLAGLVALFTAFAAAQIVTAAGGARHVLEASGLTYAEYARSGFFQLVAVAALTLGVLLALRAVTDLGSGRARTAFLVMSLAAVALTLAIVGVAVGRMDLYEREFGLTMLRLYVRVATLWIGVSFLFLAARLAGVGARRRWLTPAALAAALVALLALDVVNPEAVVARHNVAHAERTGRFDAGYLAGLSDDAVPTLAALRSRLTPADRGALRRALCPPAARGRFHGWAAWNLSRDRADRAYAVLCGSSGSGQDRSRG